LPNDDARRPEDDFARLFAESERAETQRLTAGGRKPKPLQPGDKVRGKILSIGRDTVFVELQGQQGQQAQQAEAMLDLVELRDGAGQLTVAVGDTIDAVVAEGTRKGGMVLLRRSLARGASGKLELAQAFAHRIPVEGTVTAVNKGGVEVTVAGVRAFCPISQLELRHVEDAGQYVGQKLMFHIARYEEEDRRGPNIVLSRRALLEDEARTRAVETLAKMVVGAVLPGVVTGLKDYGAFVDLGGIEGMLHVSELGFARVGRPSDVLSIGQHVSVQVIRIDQTGDAKRSQQVALSLKALETDPWETAALQFAAGSRFRGAVTRVTTFGAFVELAPGVEGLVHISELGGEGHSQRQTRAALKPGDALDVTVLAVDRERRRISLSTAPPEEPLDAEARAVVERSASPSQAGKLGTLGDLFKNVTSPGTKR
jgi:small subunit ribosomal protein S1